MIFGFLKFIYIMLYSLSWNCFCVIIALLNLLVAYVQIKNYWSDPLLVCNCLFIDLTFCLCAKHDLLILSIAYVHVLLFIELSYCLCAETGLLRFGYLLICNPWIIDLPYCLCAIIDLLTSHLACVQLHGYWGIILLMCNLFLIKYSYCCLFAAILLLK